jgi:hypothetical protein
MITRKQFLTSIGAIIAAPFVAAKVLAERREKILKERNEVAIKPEFIRKYPLTEKECFRVNENSVQYMINKWKLNSRLIKPTSSC